MGQQSNQVGCPSKLTDDLIAKAKEYLYGGYESLGDVVPSVAGLACYLEISRKSAYNYSEQSEEFLHIVEGILSLQENKLINGGLKGDFNASIAKLMLAKHGYSEKQEVDHKSSDNSMTPKGLNDFYADIGKAKPQSSAEGVLDDSGEE
ncbi:DNA-packaging protein [Providencia rettgeri]|uniref:DNA-packaging protein n=1 Tax=Providencia rettgeri TaxID=587 RepID=A0AB35L8C6_PRORE|nr:DNA-packaging protein [Providencia rettgeri]MDH2304992.1 DNA-packaging protein [Providencia rettgeri]